jgi:hypothetical protein
MINFKKIIRSRIKNFTSYRKVVKRVKELPNMEMVKVKINGIFKTVEMKVRIYNDKTN